MGKLEEQDFQGIDFKGEVSSEELKELMGVLGITSTELRRWMRRTETGLFLPRGMDPIEGGNPLEDLRHILTSEAFDRRTLHGILESVRTKAMGRLRVGGFERRGEAGLLMPEDSDEHKEGPRLITSLEQFTEAITDAVLRWHSGSEVPHLYMSIEGLSGSGKSSMALEAVENAVARIPHVPFSVIAADDFLQTERGSNLRGVQTYLPDNLFWATYRSKEAVQRLLLQICEANGKGMRATFDRMYKRSNGKGIVKPGEVIIPPGRRVIILEGTDSTDTLEVLRNAGVPMLEIFKHTPVYVCVQRLRGRDGRVVTTATNEDFRHKEIGRLDERIAPRGKEVDIVLE